jgi:uncharacterized ferritin-like protein (DUF455 family)
MSPYPTKVVRGATVRADPAREPCFKVVHDAADLADYTDMSDVARRQRLHKHMHNEMQSIEMSAQSLAEFTDAPWDARMSLARQCWDESRHTQILFARLKELGGYKGEFPVMNHEWSITCMVGSLWGRIALQNRTFEGGEIDLLKQLVKQWRDAGDPVTADLIEGILADEVQHVRYANQWLQRIGRENPVVLLQVAAAVNYAKQVLKAYEPEPGETNAVGVDLSAFEHGSVIANVEDRRLAGFTEREIDEIVRMETELVSSSKTLAAAASSD